MTTTSFYPEMNGTAPNNTDLIIETLYKRSKVKCLNGIELKESRSIEFKHNRDGNNVYYVTEAGVNQLKKKYNISYSNLSD